MILGAYICWSLVLAMLDADYIWLTVMAMLLAMPALVMIGGY